MQNLTQYLEPYFNHCTNHKALDMKTVKAYRTDLKQFIQFTKEKGQVSLKESVSEYVRYLNDTYKPKSRKRKIVGKYVYPSETPLSYPESFLLMI